MQNEIYEYKLSLKQMGLQAHTELTNSASLCTCKEADYSKSVHGIRCLHHQLIDWMMIIEYYESKKVIA
jgi:hypothetical protein